MNNRNKYIKWIILCAFFVSLIVCICVSAYKTIGSNLTETKNKENSKEINISLYRIESILKATLEGRYIGKYNNSIFIGENKKQVENGYYDIKVCIKNNKTIDIYFNKLWKEFNEKLYEDSYIQEVSTCLMKLLGEDDFLEKIHMFILSGYLDAKDIANISQTNVEYKEELEKFQMVGKIEEREFVVSISKNDKRSGKCE